MGRMIGTRHRDVAHFGERDALDHDVRAFVGHGRRCARARVTSRRRHQSSGWMGSGCVAAGRGASAFVFILLVRVLYGETVGKWWTLWYES